MHYCNGVCIYYYLLKSVVVLILVAVVTRLTYCAPCLWSHQDAAESATEALRAVFTDDRATTTFVTAARIIFAHSVFVSLLTTRLI
jgi:AhpD family alkylhydroperoxidase